MLFVFLLSDCKYLLYFWLRECLKVLFIIQSIHMLESINNLHIAIAFRRAFLAAIGERELDRAWWEGRSSRAQCGATSG